MRMTADQQSWLCKALTGLQGGSVRRYHDCMWLGFGDLWCTLERELAGMGVIRTRGRFGEDVSITERGEELARELRGESRELASA